MPPFFRYWFLKRGKKMKNIEFIKYIHYEMTKTYKDEDKYVCHGSILKNWSGDDKKFSQRVKVDDTKVKYGLEEHFFAVQFKEKEFYALCNKVIDLNEEDAYFSINSFYNIKRKSENIRHFNAFIIDYDYYKINEYKDLSPEEMYEKFIKPTLLINPTFVIDSGRGLYLIYCIKHAPYKMKNLYQAIYEQLFFGQEKFGADRKATLLTQMIRIPGSINSKSSREVKILQFNDIRYDIKELADELLPFSLEESRKYRREHGLKNNYCKFNYKGNINNFLQDIEKIIQMRNEKGIQEGYRETLLYLTYERMIHENMHQKTIEKTIIRLNQSFLKPMREDNLLKLVKPSRKFPYRSSLETIIEKLNISKEEQASLKLLVEKNEKNKRTKRNSRRDIRKMTKKQIEIKERRKTMLNLISKGYNLKEIQDELNVSKKTLLRDLQYINDHLYEFSEYTNELFISFIKGRSNTVEYSNKTLQNFLKTIELMLGQKLSP